MSLLDESLAISSELGMRYVVFSLAVMSLLTCSCHLDHRHSSVILVAVVGRRGR